LKPLRGIMHPLTPALSPEARERGKSTDVVRLRIA
jgi:hypothetical protein